MTGCVIVVGMDCQLYNESMKKNNKLAIHIEDDSNQTDFSHATFFPQPLRPTLPDEEEEEHIPPDTHQSQQPQPKVIEFEEFLVEDEREQFKTEPQGSKQHA